MTRVIDVKAILNAYSFINSPCYMSIGWDALNDVHRTMVDNMHTRQLTAYYPENFSPQTADCIAFNKLLNVNRNQAYLDIYGKTTQVPLTHYDVNIHYRKGENNGISLKESDDGLHDGNIDTTERLLREGKNLNEMSQKYTINRDTMEDTDWILIPKEKKTDFALALLPHQRQDSWPIDPFRFNKLETSINGPNSKANGYSSLGKVDSVKEAPLDKSSSFKDNGSPSRYFLGNINK